MAKFRRRIRMEKETTKKKQYLKHFRKAKASALTYAQWMKKGEQPTYFKGAGLRRPTVGTALREAKSKPFRRKVEDILKLKRKKR